jgi:hypothetical protein
MKKTAVLGCFALLAAAHLVLGSPVEPFAEKLGFRELELDPHSRETFTLRCQAKERTTAIVYGKGRSPLAVYVFDPHGNCVAKDDFAQGKMTDDLAVEWYPPMEQMYEIDVRNLGRKQNIAEVAIR